MTGQVAELPVLGRKLPNLQRPSDKNAKKFAAQIDLQERHLHQPTELDDPHAQREATAP